MKAIAGKIAHTAREGDPPAALCIGAECINLAVKVHYSYFVLARY